VDVAATDLETPIRRPGHGSTIIIRWWHETIDGAPEGDDRSLRGTVLDLGGRTLGHFAGRQSMFDLVEAITASAPERSSRSPNPGPEEA
jgi:hypothetical protein